MSDKAGAAAGFISGLIDVIVLGGISLVSLNVLRSSIIESISSRAVSPSPFSNYPNLHFEWAVTTGWAIPMIPLLLIATILGVFYAWVYDYIPIKSPIIKGLAFSIVMIIAQVLVAGAGVPYGFTFYSIMAITSVVMAIVYGVILALMFERIRVVKKTT